MAIDYNELNYNFGCGSCGYKRVYAEEPRQSIPVPRVIEALDRCFARNDLTEAGRLLTYWQEEARTLGDRSGELSVVNELLGYSRRVNDQAGGLDAVARAETLIEELGAGNTVSTATILLNAATTLKAFGKTLEAMPLYDRAGAILTAALSGSDPLLSGYYNNKALALADLQRFEEAEQCYLQALEIQRAVPNGQPEAAATYVNMAHLYEAWLADPFEKLEACLDRAEELLNDPDQPRNANYAFVCSKCAPSFDYFGYFVTSRELRERAREIYAGA